MLTPEVTTAVHRPETSSTATTTAAAASSATRARPALRIGISPGYDVLQPDAVTVPAVQDVRPGGCGAGVPRRHHTPVRSAPVS
ncbi:hypothetical protein GCM10011594_18940 [Nakamurella endophytica]|uniref:Uncharacterized protein n=1 Tax=Nakamurella endophytica TaxID=1748367 RepID=A0A917WFK5_9ACTN|nr:hypothetical protein GCM10011594_18940 [Nakamurella endophytica]